MDFLHKFYFYNPERSNTSREERTGGYLLISSNSVDFFTWYKKDGAKSDGTRLQTNIIEEKGPKREFIAHIVDGIPDIVNQHVFDELFFKCSVQFLNAEGKVKKYSSWINPNNIACMYMFLPNCTELFFLSGYRIIIDNKIENIMTSILQHNRQYKEKRKDLMWKRKENQ
jgi:hypothetical protein